MGTSIGLLLVAIVWTWYLTGTLDFQKGGILEGKVDGAMVAILLGLYAFGIGKAALMPFHRWLPSAMVAPTPVSALSARSGGCESGCVHNAQGWRVCLRYRLLEYDRCI